MGSSQLKLWSSRRNASKAVPTFAEFFAGIGLMRMGLERAGWQVAWANDIQPTKQQQYDAHFGDAHDHFVLGDVHNVDAKGIPSVDLATASFPCTDLSVAGGRAGIHAGESSAFWGFLSAIERMKSRKPRLVLLENVVGFLTCKGGRDFVAALEALNALGYGVDAFVLDAKWFVPQSRPRLFVVGSLGGTRIEVDTTASSRMRPRALIDLMRSNTQIVWDARQLPEPPLESALTLSDIVEQLPANDPAWWARDRAQYFFDQMSKRHQTTAREMMKQPKWSYGAAFRRVRAQPDGTKRSMAELRTDGLAGCLRTPKGGSGRQILFRAGFGKYDVRLLTPRECARLMGADDFAISGSLNDALFGFGDAVCVPVVTWIAQNVLAPRLAQAEVQSLKLRAPA